MLKVVAVLAVAGMGIGLGTSALASTTHPPSGPAPSGDTRHSGSPPQVDCPASHTPSTTARTPAVPRVRAVRTIGHDRGARSDTTVTCDRARR